MSKAGPIVIHVRHQIENDRSEIIARLHAANAFGHAKSTVLWGYYDASLSVNPPDRTARCSCEVEAMWRAGHFCCSHTQDRAAAWAFRTSPVDDLAWANLIAGCSGCLDRTNLA